MGAAPFPAAVALEDAETEIAKTRVALDAYRARLATWNMFWRVWPFFWAALPDAQPERPPADVVPAADPSVARKQRARALLHELTTQTLPPFDAERYAAKVAQTAVMTYLLPILYGALGAFVYVVRLVTNDIDRGSLRVLLRIRYRIRLMLGAIFGLTISMLTTQATPFMKDIPVGAVGLAFFAGYGIDVVFGLLDAVIGRARRFGAQRLEPSIAQPEPAPRAPLTEAPAPAH